MPVTDPPELAIIPNGSYHVSEGQQNVVISCVADANPVVQPSDIHWKKNNADTDRTGSTYTIGTVEKSDDGRYVCEAYNVIGNGTSTSLIIDVRCMYTPLFNCLASAKSVNSCQ